LGLPPEGVLRFGYVTAITLAMATLSWYLFEKRVNDLKHHFPYVRR
jgi:peptidoglycan/LPS O-acetylase OafA/YrhL